MGLDIEIEYVTDLQKVMEYGVMSMPALVVNDRVVSAGKVLKPADVESLLHHAGLERAGGIIFELPKCQGMCLPEKILPQ